MSKTDVDRTFKYVSVPKGSKKLTLTYRPVDVASVIVTAAATTDLIPAFYRADVDSIYPSLQPLPQPPSAGMDQFLGVTVTAVDTSSLRRVVSVDLTPLKSPDSAHTLLLPTMSPRLNTYVRLNDSNALPRSPFSVIYRAQDSDGRELVRVSQQLQLPCESRLSLSSGREVWGRRGTRLAVPFSLTNTADAEETFVLTASDALGFPVALPRRSVRVKGKETAGLVLYVYIPLRVIAFQQFGKVSVLGADVYDFGNIKPITNSLVLTATSAKGQSSSVVAHVIATSDVRDEEDLDVLENVTHIKAGRVVILDDSVSSLTQGRLIRRQTDEQSHNIRKSRRRVHKRHARRGRDTATRSPEGVEIPLDYFGQGAQISSIDSAIKQQEDDSKETHELLDLKNSPSYQILGVSYGQNDPLPIFFVTNQHVSKTRMKRYVDTNLWTHRTNPDSYQPEGWRPPITEGFYGAAARMADTTPPTIQTTNYVPCGDNVQSNTCAQSRWSANVVITDSGIGLQTVTTTPPTNVPYFKPMTPQVTLQYAASCCDPLLMVYATDAQGNTAQQAIGKSGTTVLGAGAITGIVIGVIVLLAIIIVVALLLVRRSRSKQDVELRSQRVRTTEH